MGYGLKKNQKSKHSYHNASKEKKKGRNETKRIRQRDARAELAKNPSVKRAFPDIRNKGRETARELNKFATMHNAVYLSKVDRLAETQREREGTLLFGKLCKNVSFVPARVQTLASRTLFLNDPFGSETGKGYCQTVTPGDFSKLFHCVMQ